MDGEEVSTVQARPPTSSSVKYRPVSVLRSTVEPLTTRVTTESEGMSRSPGDNDISVGSVSSTREPAPCAAHGAPHVQRGKRRAARRRVDLPHVRGRWTQVFP